MSKYKYDIAFSLAGEQKEFAQKLKNFLAENGLNCWIYTEHEHELAGRTMPNQFLNIFTQDSKYCIPVVSKDYIRKRWTELEGKYILQRWMSNEDFLIPLSLDNSIIPDLPTTVGYISLNNRSTKEIASLILKRVGLEESSDTEDHSQFRLPKQNKKFNPYEEKKEWLNFILNELKYRCSAADLYLSCEEDSKIRIRILKDNDYIYSLDITRNQLGNENGLAFSGQVGAPKTFGDNSYNAFGNFEYNKEKDTIVLNMLNFSLFNNIGEKNLYTKEEFVNKLWDLVVEEVEKI